MHKTHYHLRTYLSYGHCQQAQETLERLSGTSFPIEMFKQLYTVLIRACEDGRTEKELTLDEKQTISEIALVNEQFSVHAEAVLTQASEKKYIREPEKIIDQRSSLANETQVKNEKVSSDLPYIKVYPNPINEFSNIEFYIPSAISATQILIYDLSGKIVKEINICGSEGIVQINQEELQQGTYFCTLLCNQQIVSQTLISVVH